MILPARYKPTGSSFSSGGMSDAILCRDGHLERDVVVKALKAGTDPKRLLDELSALQTIRSKHVVQIYDVIRDASGAILAIVEEYLPGPDLTSVAPPVTSNDFLKLAYPIAEGIADIHAHQRIHRDIKRQNMKYDAEHCLKIFDFGLARDSSATASTKGLLGTPGYMAPELFATTMGGTVNFTPAIDTYAFAATLLALAFGKPPSELCQTPPTLPDPIEFFSKLAFSLPNDIEEILNLCLSPKASLRPAMADVALLLGRHILRNRHRALLVMGNKNYVLDQSNKIVILSVVNQGSLQVNYNGLSFLVGAATGDVWINNIPAVVNMPLPGSCVITLGAASLGAKRTFVTVDVSHPEVSI